MAQHFGDLLHRFGRVELQRRDLVGRFRGERGSHWWAPLRVGRIGGRDLLPTRDVKRSVAANLQGRGRSDGPHVVWTMLRRASANARKPLTHLTAMRQAWRSNHR